ncbi:MULTISPECIES: DNA-3-methyladenine glycosylase [Clostridium]|uniref:Putative 3-methyladenine DNA glycosylase n=1 Tax=Clostridium senegalense TaxID=1465809 RepID=A0A6M0H1P4_9CLOT|nr:MULTISPECIES: DNA-3-methyladenine glycosylase [Clostridium]NEU04138.1 DNA-3-methyladenine glycosylase [Clostridium senegalense]
MKLEKDFFNRDARVVAEELLGKVLVSNYNGKILKGKIVETEAYIGEIDKASHAYGGKRTKRTEPLYGEPYTAYVYFIYGMYYCFNIITNKKDIPEGVLIRAIEPIEGINIMSNLRFGKDYSDLNKNQIKVLSNGPGKLCIAMNISKDDNYEDMNKSNKIYVENNKIDNFQIIKTKRIGIDYAEEAVDFLWRYYIKDNKYISKK